jgi:hypothetical protein
MAYNSLVRRTLEYSSTVWGQHSQVCTLEAVQRHATRFADGETTLQVILSRMYKKAPWKL